MKPLLLIAFLFCIGSPCFSQIEGNRILYEQKVKKYNKMKKTGTALAVSGGILTVVGFVTLLNSSVTTVHSGSYSETYTTGHPVLGGVSFLLGIGGLGAGIPLSIVGAKSERKYQQKLDNLSVGFNANPKAPRIALSYRF